MGNPIKKLINSKIFLLVLVGILVLIVLGCVRLYYEDYQVNEQINKLNEESDNLEAKKLKLLDVLSYVQSKAYVEEKARTELGLIKPGEKEAIINSPETTDIGQVENKVIELEQISNPVKWWRYFFNNND